MALHFINFCERISRAAMLTTFSARLRLSIRFIISFFLPPYIRTLPLTRRDARAFSDFISPNLYLVIVASSVGGAPDTSPNWFFTPKTTQQEISKMALFRVTATKLNETQVSASKNNYPGNGRPRDCCWLGLLKIQGRLWSGDGYSGFWVQHKWCVFVKKLKCCTWGDYPFEVLWLTERRPLKKRKWRVVAFMGGISGIFGGKPLGLFLLRKVITSGYSCPQTIKRRYVVLIIQTLEAMVLLSIIWIFWFSLL